MIFYVPVAYILYLGNLEYSNYPSILGCLTESVCFLDFLLRDTMLSRILYFHNIPLNIISVISSTFIVILGLEAYTEV
jgi:hypothetical protein